MNEKKFWKIILTIFLLIGVTILVVGAVLTIKNVNFIRTAVKSQGVVIDLLEVETYRDNRKITFYKPVVEFTTVQGELRVFNSSSSSNPSHYDIGETVNVLYDPKNENKAEIDDNDDLFFGGFLCLFMGSIWVGVSSLGLYVVNGGRPSSIVYTASFDPSEAAYLLFGNKVCPDCHGALVREREDIDRGIGPTVFTFDRSHTNFFGQRYRSIFHYRCKQCDKKYSLKELSKNT